MRTFSKYLQKKQNAYAYAYNNVGNHKIDQWGTTDKSNAYANQLRQQESILNQGTISDDRQQYLDRQAQKEYGTRLGKAVAYGKSGLNTAGEFATGISLDDLADAYDGTDRNLIHAQNQQGQQSSQQMFIPGGQPVGIQQGLASVGLSTQSQIHKQKTKPLRYKGWEDSKREVEERLKDEAKKIDPNTTYNPKQDMNVMNQVAFETQKKAPTIGQEVEKAYNANKGQIYGSHQSKQPSNSNDQMQMANDQIKKTEELEKQGSMFFRPMMQQVKKIIPNAVKPIIKNTLKTVVPDVVQKNQTIRNMIGKGVASAQGNSSQQAAQQAAQQLTKGQKFKNLQIGGGKALGKGVANMGIQMGVGMGISQGMNQILGGDGQQMQLPQQEQQPVDTQFNDGTYDDARTQQGGTRYYT